LLHGLAFCNDRQIFIEMDEEAMENKVGAAGDFSTPRSPLSGVYV